MHKTVVIVGLGIGKLYVDVCKSIGWNVITVDFNKSLNPDFIRIEDALRNVQVDMGIICTPNFTHQPIATTMAKCNVPRIVVEKPGFANLWEWMSFYKTFPQTKLFMVKNNQYRDILNSIPRENINKIQLFWANKNRIPGAGSWFTNETLAFGGVSRDLMPHLLSAAQILCNEPLHVISAIHHQQYDMESVANDSSYGNFQENGIYDVDDCACIEAKTDSISIQCIATWKFDIDADIIKWKIHTTDGILDLEMGLCPESAYESMLLDYMSADSDTYAKHQIYDFEIHQILEEFTESPQTVSYIKDILDENKNIS